MSKKKPAKKQSEKESDKKLIEQLKKIVKREDSGYHLK